MGGAVVFGGVSESRGLQQVCFVNLGPARRAGLVLLTAMSKVKMQVDRQDLFRPKLSAGILSLLLTCHEPNKSHNQAQIQGLGKGNPPTMRPQQECGYREDGGFEDTH